MSGRATTRDQRRHAIDEVARRYGCRENGAAKTSCASGERAARVSAGFGKQEDGRRVERRNRTDHVAEGPSVLA